MSEISVVEIVVTDDTAPSVVEVRIPGIQGPAGPPGPQSVPFAREINSGDGLTGGGDLSADRTLAVDATVVRTTRQVATSGGLTGGGDLSGNRTLSIADGGVTLAKLAADAKDIPQARADIASATTTDIGGESTQYLRVTGTTTITGLGTAAAGVVRDLLFADALTITHNATSLINLSGDDITTAAGDVARFRSEGSGNWRMVDYSKADGTSLVGSAVLSAIRVYDVAGSPYTWNKPANLHHVVVEVWAGGGGSAGGYGSVGSSGSGGGGGYGLKRIAAASLGATETATVGDGGSGATATTDNATSGGTSSFGTHISCTGGARGRYFGSDNSPGGAGGAPTGADDGINGAKGSNGSGNEGLPLGGLSPRGGPGGVGGPSANTTGAVTGGTPGGGAASARGSTQAGANGGAGRIVVYEYTRG